MFPYFKNKTSDSSHYDPVPHSFKISRPPHRSSLRLRATNLRQVHVVLLQVDEVRLDEQVDGLDVVLVLVPVLDQAPRHVLVGPLRAVRALVLQRFQHQDVRLAVLDGGALSLRERDKSGMIDGPLNKVEVSHVGCLGADDRDSFASLVDSARTSVLIPCN